MRVLFLLIIFPILLFSQNESDSIRTIAITLNDGAFYKGTVIKDDSLLIQLTLPNGVIITAPKSNIKEIKYSIVKKDTFYRDPSDHRLVITPTARTLKKGKGFFSNSQIFVLSAGYGFDR